MIFFLFSNEILDRDPRSGPKIGTRDFGRNGKAEFQLIKSHIKIAYKVKGSNIGLSKLYDPWAGWVTATLIQTS